MENAEVPEFDRSQNEEERCDGDPDDVVADEPVPPELFEQRLQLAIKRLIPVAQKMLDKYRRSATMYTSALISDALTRLIAASTDQPIDRRSQRHLIGSAVLAMRSVLVERARRKFRHKRNARLQSIDELPADAFASTPELDHSVADGVDIAMRRIAEQRPRVARALELRFFGGLSIAECGAVLGVSERQASSLLADGKRMLARELRDLRTDHTNSSDE